MDKKTERDRFEVEHKRQFPYCDELVRSGKGYDDYDIHQRWIGWHMARLSDKRTVANRGAK